MCVFQNSAFSVIWQYEFLPFRSSFAPPPVLLHSLLSLAKDLVREAVDANEIFSIFHALLSCYVTMGNEELTVQTAQNEIRHSIRKASHIKSLGML